MNKRLLQFLSICYRYNKHHNIFNRIYINVIGQDNAIIIYKQFINSKYRIKGFETNLNVSEIMDTIQDFFGHVPYYPEIQVLDFKTFPEYLNYNNNYYIDNTKLDYII